MKGPYVLTIALFIAASAFGQEKLGALPEMMMGSFNSAEQAANDSDYYDITLHMYQIWPNEEAVYLYVEQAVTSMQDKPYRQRVYKVEEQEDGYISSVYTLEHDSLYIGKWQEPDFFNKVKPEDLMEREGCAVYMKAQGPASYKGSTDGNACKSTLRGASYATSTVEVRPGVVTSWDQGFDADGKQVWGAEKGPYVFKQLK